MKLNEAVITEYSNHDLKFKYTCEKCGLVKQNSWCRAQECPARDHFQTKTIDEV